MGYTREEALAALEALVRLSRPWLGVRRDGGATIEIACAKCEASERFAVVVGPDDDESLNRWLAAFMGTHQHST